MHVIVKESQEIDLVKDASKTHIDMDRGMNQVSPTLQQVLEDISPFSVNILTHSAHWPYNHCCCQR